MRDTVFKFVNSELHVVMVGVESVENVVDIFRFDEEEGVVNVTHIELDLHFLSVYQPRPVPVLS